MVVPKVSGGGVDPDRQQTAGFDAGRGGGQVRVRGVAVAVLEHLDADHQREALLGGQVRASSTHRSNSTEASAKSR